MAQKVNPTIIRINRTNNWDSKYIEKKSTEFHLNTSKDIEIKNYVYIYLKKKGLVTQKIKTYFYNSHLVLVVYYQQNNNSFFILTLKEQYKLKKTLLFEENNNNFSPNKQGLFERSIYDTKNSKEITTKKPLTKLFTYKVILNNLNKKIVKLLKRNLAKKLFKKQQQNNLIFLKKTKKIDNEKISSKLKKIIKILKQQQKLVKNIRKEKYLYKNVFLKKKVKIHTYINKVFYKKTNNLSKKNIYCNLKEIILRKIRRIKKIKQFKIISNLKQFKTFQNLAYNSFLNPLFEGLKLFYPHISAFKLILKPLNNNNLKKLTTKQKTYLEKKIGAYRKYEKNKFFFEGLNTLFSIISTKNSSKLLSNYIAVQLKNLKKKHSFFIRFIKLALNLFLKKLFNPLIKSVKVEIKGRINGSGRARKRKLLIGSLPVLTLDSKINYFKSTAFTRNGTISVKVWILEN